MSITLESIERINALKNGIEAVTGESYEDLTSGVQALKNGYGQSGFPYIDTSKMASFAYFHSGGANIEFINKWDTSNATNLSNMFNNCPLGDYVLDINTSKAENCDSMCSGIYQHSNVQFKNKLDMSNCVSCNSMFYSRRMTDFPLKNTGKVTTFRLAFQNCLFTEVEMDISSCTDIRSAFIDCKNLKKLILHNSQITSSYWENAVKGCTSLEDFYIDYFKVTSTSADFSTCNSLSIESLINLLEVLVDNTGVYDGKGNPYSIKLGSNNITKLKNQGIEDHQDELYYILIATNKNINLV